MNYFVRPGMLAVLLAAAGCGGGASNDDLIKSCIASEEALEQEMASRFSSHRQATPEVMEAKRECCRRTIEGSKLPGSVRTYLLKDFEYKSLRSGSGDRNAVTAARDSLDKQYDGLSDKHRKQVSGINVLMTSCSTRATRGR